MPALFHVSKHSFDGIQDLNVIEKLRSMIPNYEKGGDDWTIELNPMQQTPIDIPKEEVVEFESKLELDLLYKELNNVYLENALWTVKLEVPKEDEVGSLYAYDLDGVGPLHYIFQQFHFHAPSEHKLNGK